MSSVDITAYMLAVLMSGLTPGPTMLTVASNSISRSINEALFIAIGVQASNLVMIILAALIKYLGFSFFENWQPELSMIGALSLSIIGVRLIISSLKKNNRGEGVKLESNRNPFLIGFVIHSINPGTIFFYISIFLSIVPMDSMYFSNVTLLGFFALFVDTIAAIVYIILPRFLGESFHQFDRLKRVFFGTHLFSGIVILFLGVKSLIEYLL